MTLTLFSDPVFPDLNGREDRLAIVVTEPLNTNEAWTPLVANQLTVFVDGARREPVAAKKAAKKKAHAPDKLPAVA